MAATNSCRACGRELGAGDQFCPGCGTGLAHGDPTSTLPHAQEPMTNPTQCVRCGAAMAREDRFCPRCGGSRPEPATLVSHVSLRNSQAQQLIEAAKGEFEVIQQLGTGAMGAVYLARDVALDRKVAIKVIAPNLLADETMISRFRLEAQTVASLRHPHIVNVHAVRQANDLHYFVMQLIDGPPLRNVVEEHAPLDVDVVRALLFQVGSALAYAHRTSGGVIHRDVKPANIMVDREGDAFITDFGISKIAEAQTGLTQTGATIGTPEYMSPEQCRGEALTGASDQYALGVVAYEMLCGHTPFTGTQYHVMVAHTSEPPRAVLEVRPDCPPQMADAVERMLAKAPHDRWPDLDAAMLAMGGAPLGYHDPVRRKIKALTGATLLSVPAVGTGASVSGSPSLDTAQSVTVTGLPPVLEAGERYQLTADVRGAGNVALSPGGVAWASTDPRVARVDGDWVEGVSPGSVSITASAGNVATSVMLSVAEPAPAKVLVRPSSIRMQRGGRIMLAAEVQDRRGRPVEREIRWTSSDADVAAVTRQGEVVATGSGPVTITAASGGVRGAAEVVVEPASRTVPAARRTETPATGIEAGAPPAPAARPKPPAPRSTSTQPPPARPWYRRRAAVAAALAGAVALSALALSTRGGGLAEADVPAPTTSSAEGSDAARAGGAPASPGTDAVEAAVEPDGGGVVATPSDPSPQTGAPGRTDPPATDDRSAGAGSAPAPAPRRVEVSLASTSMPPGGTQSATAQVFAAGGDPMPGGSYSLSWRSSDPAVVAVQPDGALRAAAAGSAWIVAAAGSARDSVLVTVALRIASLEIAGGDLGLEVASPPRSLTATVRGPDGEQVVGTPSWSSSDPAVARVDAAGRVTAVRAGAARITAALDGFSDQVTVTVADPAPALPTPAEARAAVEAWVAAVGRGDGDFIASMWDGTNGQRDELLEQMREREFRATLQSVTEPVLREGVVGVGFQVQVTWRTSFGQNRSRDLRFIGRLESAGQAWRLAAARPQLAGTGRGQAPDRPR